MDYNYLNDQAALSLHRLDDWSVRESLQKMPEGYNPFTKHYEETELEHNRHYYITGGELAKQIPPEFGDLAHPNSENGEYYFRYNHGYQGLARSEDNGAYEAAKYNQRLNPRVDRVGKYGPQSGHITCTDDMKAGSLVHFPNVGGLVTSALYKASNVPFAQSEAAQNSRFFESIWNNRDIRDLIMEKLFGYTETLSNLTRTCQKVRRDVEGMMGYFDTNDLNFNLCDKFPEDLEAMIQKGKITREDVDNIRVPKFLVIGPCRKPLTMAHGYHGNPAVFWPPQVEADDLDQSEWYTDLSKLQGSEGLFNERGFRMNTGYTQEKKRMTYKRKCGVVQRSLIAFDQHGKNFHYLALVQLDFMNVMTVEAIIGSLVNLKCLCLYSCPLIDLSAVKAVIDIVAHTNKKRREAGKPLLDLDIAPQYRQGPIFDRMGSYGITHSDPRIFQGWKTDVGHALAANLVSLTRAAKRAEIDLLQPGKAFRRWIDRLPLAINQAYNLCAAAKNFVSNEETRESYAREVYPNEGDEFDRGRLMKAFDETVSIDLVAAATAKPVVMQDFKQQRELRCTKCNEKLPGILFRYEASIRRPEFVICEGCDLHNQLHFEFGNNHRERKGIAAALWHDAPKGRPRLSWLLGVSKIALRNNKRFLKYTEQLKTPEVCMAEAEALTESRDEIIREMKTIFDFRVKQPLKEKLIAVDRSIEELRVRAGLQRKPQTGNESMYDWEYRRKAYHWRTTVESGEYVHGAPYENHTMLSLEKAFCMRH